MKRGQQDEFPGNRYSHYRFISFGLNWAIYIFNYSKVEENIHHFLGIGSFSMFSSAIVFFSGFC